MGRALRWTYKLLKAWRDEGFGGMIKAGINRIIFKGEAQDHEYSAPIRTVTDVLFINGCPPEQAPHPYRYRVTHQKEQLIAAGYTVSEISDAECSAASVLSGNIIVFYRCPYTEKVGAAIRQAKAMNKRVIFDIDDLVVDTVYTDTIPEVQKFGRADRALYDEGVTRYGATLRICEAATTTTTRLRNELAKMVPKAYINRNRASEEMVLLSEKAWRNVKETREAVGQEETKRKTKGAEENVFVERESGDVILGYFSGTITHNADFEMVKSAILQVMDENVQVKLLLMGKLDLPAELAAYGNRIIQKPFVDWKELPAVIAGVDINLAPIEDSIFNEAKSENKWVEAALVKVPTVASRVGAFAEQIRDGETGWLAGEDEWYKILSLAVRDKAKRREIGEAAYQYCKENYITTGSAGNIRKIYEDVRAPHAAFVLPSSEISGGIMVALRHACMMQDAGWNVDMLVRDYKWPIWKEFGHEFSCIAYIDGSYDNQSYYDLMVATMWSTVDYVQRYPRVGTRAYLVQNYETDFYEHGNPERLACESTYHLPRGWKYLTISQWVEGWLRERYHQEVARMRNGMESDRFQPRERDWNGRKIRVLIEGDSAADYKNVDESFRIAGKLDPEKYEIWYMSYNAAPKETYRVDRFLHAVPYEQVGDVYRECDILLKSSWLESFSYPPLEMMATGGWNVLVQNGGNSEYVRDGENCLTYPLGDEDAAVAAIQRIVEDAALRERLKKGGLRTAGGRDWESLRTEIVETYRQAAGIAAKE